MARNNKTSSDKKKGGIGFFGKITNKLKGLISDGDKASKKESASDVDEAPTGEPVSEQPMQPSSGNAAEEAAVAEEPSAPEVPENGPVVGDAAGNDSKPHGADGGSSSNPRDLIVIDEDKRRRLDLAIQEDQKRKDAEEAEREKRNRLALEKAEEQEKRKKLILERDEKNRANLLMALEEEVKLRRESRSHEHSDDSVTREAPHEAAKEKKEVKTALVNDHGKKVLFIDVRKPVAEDASAESESGRSADDDSSAKAHEPKSESGEKRLEVLAYLKPKSGLSGISGKFLPLEVKPFDSHVTETIESLFTSSDDIEVGSEGSSSPGADSPVRTEPAKSSSEYLDDFSNDAVLSTLFGESGEENHYELEEKEASSDGKTTRSVGDASFLDKPDDAETLESLFTSLSDDSVFGSDDSDVIDFSADTLEDFSSGEPVEKGCETGGFVGMLESLVSEVQSTLESKEHVPDAPVEIGEKSGSEAANAREVGPVCSEPVTADSGVAGSSAGRASGGFVPSSLAPSLSSSNDVVGSLNAYLQNFKHDMAVSADSVEQISESAAESEIVLESEPVVESKSAAEREIVSEPEVAAESEPVLESEPVAESKSAAECEPVSEPESVSEPVVVPESESDLDSYFEMSGDSAALRAIADSDDDLYFDPGLDEPGAPVSAPLSEDMTVSEPEDMTVSEPEVAAEPVSESDSVLESASVGDAVEDAVEGTVSGEEPLPESDSEDAKLESGSASECTYSVPSEALGAVEKVEKSLDRIKKEEDYTYFDPNAPIADGIKRPVDLPLEFPEPKFDYVSVLETEHGMDLFAPKALREPSEAEQPVDSDTSAVVQSIEFEPAFMPADDEQSYVSVESAFVDSSRQLFDSEPALSAEVVESVSSSEIAEPVSSAEVIEPVHSAEVVESASSAEVSEPVSSAEVIESVQSAEVSEPVSSAEVIESVQSAEVSKPVSSAEVLEPVSSAEVIEPVPSAEVADPVSSSEVLEPVSSAEVIESVQSAEVSEPVSSAEVIESVQSAEVSEPVSSAEVIDSVHSAEVSEPVSSAEVIESVHSAEVSEPVSSAEVIESFQSAEVSEPVSSAEVRESVPSAEVMEPVPSAEVIESVPSAEVSEPVPSAEVIESVPSAEVIEPVPSAEVRESVPSAEVMEPVPSAEVMEPVPSAEVLEPVSSAEVLEPASSSEVLEPAHSAEVAEPFTSNSDSKSGDHADEKKQKPEGIVASLASFFKSMFKPRPVHNLSEAKARKLEHAAAEAKLMEKERGLVVTPVSNSVVEEHNAVSEEPKSASLDSVPEVAVEEHNAVSEEPKSALLDYVPEVAVEERNPVSEEPHSASLDSVPEVAVEEHNAVSEEPRSASLDSVPAAVVEERNAVSEESRSVSIDESEVDRPSAAIFDGEDDFFAGEDLAEEIDESDDEYDDLFADEDLAEDIDEGDEDLGFLDDDAEEDAEEDAEDDAEDNAEDNAEEDAEDNAEDDGEKEESKVEDESDDDSDDDFDIEGLDLEDDDLEDEESLPDLDDLD